MRATASRCVQLAASDIAPERALKKVMNVLQEGGYDVIFDVTSLHMEAQILLVGTPQPAIQENLLVKQANERGIPTALYADTWGAAERIVTPVDIAFVADELDATRTMRRTPHKRVLNIGDPLSTHLPNPVVLPGDRYNLLIVGQGLGYTRSVVSLVRDCIALEPAKWRVFPRLIHPKYMDTPEAQEILRELSSFPSGTIIEESPEISTDTLSVSCDVVASVFSTTLRYAALTGKVALSILTPESMEGMRASTGHETFPLSSYSYSAAAEIRRPRKFSFFLNERSFSIRTFSIESYRRSVRFKQNLLLEALASM